MAHLHDGDLFEHDGFDFKVYIEDDQDSGTPWDREDGHGPVSDWTTRDKQAGELVLHSGRSHKRYYDFAEACKIARRDGWGFMPYKLEVTPVAGEFADYEKRGGTVNAGPYSAFDPDDFNKAIAEVYRLHRETMTPRQYAAAAAMSDFDRLRRWCDDQWNYVGVRVEHMDFDADDDFEGDSESLWGIESDCDEYIDDVARELAGEIAERLKAQRDNAQTIAAQEMESARPDLYSL